MSGAGHPGQAEKGGRRGACMRKLAMVYYGVLKHRAPFDPD